MPGFDRVLAGLLVVATAACDDTSDTGSDVGPTPGLGAQVETPNAPQSTAGPNVGSPPTASDVGDDSAAGGLAPGAATGGNPPGAGVGSGAEPTGSPNAGGFDGQMDQDPGAGDDGTESLGGTDESATGTGGRSADDGPDSSGDVPDGGVDPGSDVDAGQPARGQDPSPPTYPFSDPNAKYPFPQMVTYQHGVQSENIGHEFVAQWYENWKQRYLVECNGMVMPSTENDSISKVEAQGFSMIAVAYMADKETFDGLYAFYNSKLQSSSCGLSAWRTNCGGVQDSGAATDGDIDVASALVVAHWQWPDDGYDDEARKLIDRLEQVLVGCGELTAVYPGCSGGRPWGGCDETDISYYSPGFFRYFAQLSGNDIWNKLADDTSIIRDNAAHPDTGLVPDWQSVAGRAGSGSRVGSYGFDAIRAPFKQALDFLWHGNEPTRVWCEKITTWANGVGVERLVDGYQLDGAASGRSHNMAVVGSLAVCASANTQQVVDNFVAESGKLRDDFWYSGYLGNLYLLAMTGNMWHRDMMGD